MKDASDSIDEKIAFEALKRAFQSFTRTSYYQIVLLPIMVAMVMWSQVDHGWLTAWCLLVFLSIYLRRKVATSFFKREADCQETKKWSDLFTYSSVFSSSLWTAAVFLMYVPGSAEHQVFIFTLCVTLSVSSIISGMYWLPSFYVFVFPVLGAVIIRAGMEGTLAYLSLAFFMSWYLLLTTALAKTLHQSTWSEMKLHHKSAALAEALQVKTEEALQATHAKSRFLAAASHDLRQPMHALSLFIDALKESKTDNERNTLFRRVDTSLTALRKLFDSLLDVSKLDANVVNPALIHIDLTALLTLLAGEYGAEASENNLTLKLHSKGAYVISDPLLLERIIRNLISNALRYTNSGGVLLSTRIRKDKVLLQVWDTGVGISEEDQEKVFSEFCQLPDAHRDRAQGLGLGLAIVKRLCRLLGHPLRLTSKRDRGSVFSIVMPRGEEKSLVTRHNEGRMQDWDLSERCILVIDDDGEILAAMQALLSRWGCTVMTAKSLGEVLEKIDSTCQIPELILSDLSLQNGMTGIEVISRLQEQLGKSIEGILITGETTTEKLRLAKNSGLEVLQKPVKPIRLRAVIQHYLIKNNSKGD